MPVNINEHVTAMKATKIRNDGSHPATNRPALQTKTEIKHQTWSLLSIFIKFSEPFPIKCQKSVAFRHILFVILNGIFFRWLQTLNLKIRGDNFPHDLPSAKRSISIIQDLGDGERTNIFISHITIGRHQ